MQCIQDLEMKTLKILTLRGEGKKLSVGFLEKAEIVGEFDVGKKR